MVGYSVPFPGDDSATLVPPMGGLMDAAALGSLIGRMAAEEGLHLPSAAIPQLATHLAMTLRWSRAISLTAIRNPEDAVRRHVLESLQAAGHLNPRAGGLLDVGSGNGYPALPAKCLNPELRVTLLEPAIRRSVFLESVVRALGLEGVEVRRNRVDRASDLRGYQGIGNITMRGVNALQEVLDGGSEVLPVGGRIVVLTSTRSAAASARRTPSSLSVLTIESIAGRSDGRILVLERTQVG